MDPKSVQALVVDDDAMIVALLSAFLRRRGYQVRTASDGRAALELLAQADANLVLTDLDMPVLDGLGLARRLREMPGAGYRYCIMLTSMGNEASLVAAMEAGVDDFLPKPIRLPELGARLRAAERVIELEATLLQRNRKLADAYAQLERELDLARALQLSQLPRERELAGLSFEWIFEASSYVGGDTFDYYSLDERYHCFYLADVSGHGVAAAMMAVNTQHQLGAATQHANAQVLRKGGSLEEAALLAVTDYNRRFLQMQESSLYLTMAYGLVDTVERRAALVQAGHPAPLWSARPGEPFVPVGEGGLPIGIVPEPDFEARVVPLEPGSRIVLYSDGITDCRDESDAPYTFERFEALLAQGRASTLQETGAAIRQSLVDWRGSTSFTDDITFLALEMR
ncbi:PP2C family protein-serine/threonine phosphatase [Ramlibacter sp.]|uniref:PP2C family protein-serine/threonine phosphatase n=1 Tax=Ramlibacter sp. TaxID=1917967 RepID=UPI003D09C65E